MFPVPMPLLVPSTLSQGAVSAMQKCIAREIEVSQKKGYEADESEVTEYCEARTK
jgi:hypothetical protein